MTLRNQGIDQISEKLITYLRDRLNDSMIDYDSPLTLLPGGFQTYIYRFKLNGVREELSKSLILRLYPQFYGTRNAIWESVVQNVLVSEGFPVAQAYFTCTDMSILGGAFFIMDFLPGKPMMIEPIETIPKMLGKTHAALHSIDPEPLIESLSEQGIDKHMWRQGILFDWLKEKANERPWIREGVDWLIKNRPPESKRLTVCHGDFHPLNILIQDGKVTGVLDWGNFLISDPILDIANTIVVITVAIKHFASVLYPSVDWQLFVEEYLDAYRSKRILDCTHLDYYRVMKSVKSLIQASEGLKVWRHPLILKDLIEYIQKITEIQLTISD
ncbi:MAG: phosphotransferase family protein [Candidatus Hermodarchaeota archaeon]